MGPTSSAAYYVSLLIHILLFKSIFLGLYYDSLHIDIYKDTASSISHV